MRRRAEYLEQIPERYCHKCQEWWPEDEDFFYRSRGIFVTPCIACIQEQKQQASAVKPCCIPGCNNPRHLSSGGRYTSYCTAHRQHKRKQEYQPKVVQQ